METLDQWTINYLPDLKLDPSFKKCWYELSDGNLIVYLKLYLSSSRNSNPVRISDIIEFIKAIGNERDLPILNEELSFLDKNGFLYNDGEDNYIPTNTVNQIRLALTPELDWDELNIFTKEYLINQVSENGQRIKRPIYEGEAYDIEDMDDEELPYDFERSFFSDIDHEILIKDIDYLIDVDLLSNGNKPYYIERDHYFLSEPFCSFIEEKIWFDKNYKIWDKLNNFTKIFLIQTLENHRSDLKPTILTYLDNEIPTIIIDDINKLVETEHIRKCQNNPFFKFYLSRELIKFLDTVLLYSFKKLE